MRWILPSENPALAQALAGDLGLHPVCARILVARGIDSLEAASHFLRDRLADLPDPSSLLGLDRAVSRLLDALRQREKIALFGDYDVDGISASALLATFLRGLGADVTTSLPNRLDEGYGLSRAAVERAAASGSRLLVTLDCGISSLDEADLAASRGIDLVVVDHHQPGPTLPRACAIVDPHQPGCPFPDKNLCAAGLAFLLAVALRRALRDRGAFAARAEPDLRELLDLAALGTIADVVPLVGVNRILVTRGLAELQRASRPGVRALKSVAGFAAAAPLTAGQVAFRLAPRINAAGRLADPRVALELLTTSDASRAYDLAVQLDAANAERQAVERHILDEALEDAEAMLARKPRSLVLARQGWHPGVIGIVASRVVERFHRPTFVIALDGSTGRGSGRSISGFHLFQALQRCSRHLLRYGGHSHAAGLALECSELDAFREALEVQARAALTDDDLIPSFRVDARVRTEELDPALATALQRLGPFGAGNPEPVLAATGLRAAARVLPARNGGPGHLKLALAGAPHLDTIGFGLAEQAALASEPFDAAFQIGLDDWNGLRRISLRIKALRRAA